MKECTEEWYRLHPNDETAQLGKHLLTKGLMSHSFRRGSALWCSIYGIAVQWICGRGMWNLDALSRAFTYIGIVLDQDIKVAQRLSDWGPNARVRSPSLDSVSISFSNDDLKALKRVFITLHLYIFKSTIYFEVSNTTKIGSILSVFQVSPHRKAAGCFQCGK